MTDVYRVGRRILGVYFIPGLFIIKTKHLLPSRRSLTGGLLIATTLLHIAGIVLLAYPITRIKLTQTTIVTLIY